MKKHKGSERRKYPRANADFSIKFAGKESGIVARVENISCSGAYCVVNEFIPLYTRLQLKLFIPSAKDKAEEKINCEGVIVRIKEMEAKEKGSAFHIAIFFSQIEEQKREKIAGYVEEHLPGESDKPTC